MKSFKRPFVGQRTVEKFQKGVRLLQSRIHLLTAPLRLLPDFIIIGAQKGGTTSLYHYLAQHPSVAPALKKEVHFFDSNFSKGLRWYRAQFSSSFYRYYAKNVWRRDLITGEASPYYILHPQTPKRVFETVPEAKLIVLLRSPVDRAYSHYQHNVRKRREPLSFEEAIKAEPDRLRGECEKMLADENYVSFNHSKYSYLARGIYLDQLKMWLNFFPREQLLVLKSEDFFANPAVIYRQVLEFLNLPDWELKTYETYFAGCYRTTMAPSTRKYLVDYFAPHNQRLYQYLGMDWGWDK
jgi:Sulfotransferase domain